MFSNNVQNENSIFEDDTLQARKKNLDIRGYFDDIHSKREALKD